MTDKSALTAGHTPGPWYLHQQNREYVVGDCDLSLETREQAFLLLCHHPDVPARANARLIAAAPDLLEALDRLERAASAHLDCSDGSEREYLREEMSNARAAIAKATGSYND